MPRFYDEVGYATTVESTPGVWTPTIIKKFYYGEVVKDFTRISDTNTTTNSELNVSNKFSILPDSYGFEHFGKIRYVKWMNTKWKVTSVDVQPPRLILSVGGVYNG